MKKLGEQWVEVIDGKMHMLKAVEGVLCNGCMYGSMSLFGNDSKRDFHLCSFDGECPVGAGNRHNLQIPDTIVKDLGELNEDGLLPCPFCGEYPKIIYPTENMPVVSIVHLGGTHRVLLEFFRNEQEAIDAWNRRE
jgi:hypothetical protein